MAAVVVGWRFNWFFFLVMDGGWWVGGKWL